MKAITIDEDAHQILLEAKASVRKTGQDHATLSDGIRWLNKKEE